MPRRSPRIHFLVLTADGARSYRLGVPRSLLRCGAGVLMIAVMITAFYVSEYQRLRNFYAAHSSLETRLLAQQQTNAQLRSTLDDIRKEVGAWPALQAEILTPFDQTPPASASPKAADQDRDEMMLSTVRGSTSTLKHVAGLMTRLHETISQLPSQSPTRTAINSGFGNRRDPWTGGIEFHRGVDLAANTGTAVRAPAAGDVVFTGGHGEYGLTVIVEHAGDVRTLYGHLSAVSVRRGERVTRGQVLGKSGSTGHSTGPHLHYEVQVAGRPVNPRPFIWQ